MTGRERVWAALRGGPLDRPPKGEILLTPGLVKEFSCPDLQSVLAYLNADLRVLPINQLNPTPALWKSWSKTGYFVFGLFQGPITFLAGELGWHKLSHLLLKKTGEAREVMHKYIMRSLKPVMAALEEGCKGIIIADDLAGDRGPLISPVFLKENYFPLIAFLLKELGCRHVPCIFHSDGNILELISHLREAGFWGIHGLQPSVGIGAGSFRRQDLANWVYWGNFEFEEQGGLKSVTDVKTEVGHLLTNWAGFPGYIFGSSGGLYEGLSPEAIKAAYDAVNSWGDKNRITHEAPCDGRYEPMLL